ncbi:general secretion pathway protein GspB [Vibrio rumoiensis]|uniref:General secretion pathway protein GspB n=1 Tax=Vibrio rumoiensis TaxID=76258 RepID=A0ABW7IWG8_9VIBR
MSEVMKALQQSEQAYQAQIAPSHLSSQGSFQTVKTTRWWLIPSLVLLPIIATCTLLVYQQLTRGIVDAPSINDGQRNASLLTFEANTPMARLLSYPELTALAPLPKVIIPPKPKLSPKVKPINHTSEGKRIKTDQIDFSQSSNQDWNVDNLDLSGLSPELAQRFESALEKHPSQVQSTKQATLMPSKPENAINLVGHERDYRGRLPKMNFETHMYSSKPQSRWIKVNGKEIHEGEWVINKLVKLDQILPGSLIVTFDNQQLQIPALYEWGG